MKNVLLISIAFPPKSDPESIQVARYIKYLQKDNYTLEVLTSKDPTLYMETDKALEKYAKYADKILKIKIFENRYLNYVIRKIAPRMLEYPDSKFIFHMNNSRLSKPSLIYSRSYPLSSTFKALKLKKKWPDIPWILHLSDPWAISYEGDSPATNFQIKSRTYNKRVEYEAFSLADKVTLTSKKTIELYKRSYPEYQDKFILFPNVYDPEIVNINPLNFEDRLLIVYTGGFGEKRSPRFFLNGIKKTLESNQEMRDRVEFIFTGPMTRNNAKIFQEFSEIDQINHLGVISYQEMIRIQHSAHILVNIDSPISDANHAVFFPSKLLEYIAAKRRILTITSDGSTSEEIVRGGFGDYVHFDEMDSLNGLLLRYFKAFEEQEKSFFVNSELTDFYSAKSNASRLEELIKTLI